MLVKVSADIQNILQQTDLSLYSVDDLIPIWHQAIM